MLTWIWDHKWVVFIAIGAVLAIVLSRVLGGGSDGPDPMDSVRDEMRVVNATRDARQARIDLGEERALQQVEEKYADKKEQLDEKEQAKIKKYENDPVALARAMERASRG